MESTHCSPASITTGKFWIANGLKWEPKNNYLEIYQPDRPTDHSLHLQDNPTKSEARMRLVLLRPMISAHKTMFTVVAINGFKCAKCNSNMLWMLKGRWRRGNKRVVSISAKLHLHSPSLESNQFQFLPPSKQLHFSGAFKYDISITRWKEQALADTNPMLFLVPFELIKIDFIIYMFRH